MQALQRRAGARGHTVQQGAGRALTPQRPSLRPQAPAQQQRVRVAAGASIDPDNASILVCGGGGVALEVTRKLKDMGSWVWMLQRNDTRRKEIEGMMAIVAKGDATKRDEVDKAFAAIEEVDAVVSTIGGSNKDPTADSLGNINIIEAAAAKGVKKFILVTSIGCGDSKDAPGEQVYKVLEPVLKEKDKAEARLKELGSSMAFTIIRPGGLKSEPATGGGVLTADASVCGSITRADVADLVIKALLSSKTDNTVLSAVDKDGVFGDKEFEVFSLSMAESAAASNSGSDGSGSGSDLRGAAASPPRGARGQGRRPRAKRNIRRTVPLRAGLGSPVGGGGRGGGDAAVRTVPLRAGLGSPVGGGGGRGTNDAAVLAAAHALYARLPKRSKWARHKLKVVTKAMALLRRGSRRPGGKDGAGGGGSGGYGSYQQKRRAAALERQKHARQDKVAELRSLAAAAGAEDEAMAEGAQEQQQQAQQQQQQQAPARAGDQSPSGRGGRGGHAPRRRHAHHAHQQHHHQQHAQLPADTALYGTDAVDLTRLSGAGVKAYFARQLMQPEWLSDVPPDLATSWCAPRRGARGRLHAQGGTRGAARGARAANAGDRARGRGGRRLVMPRPEGRRCLVISTGGWTYARSRTGALLARFASRLPGGGPGGSQGGGPPGYCVLDCILQEEDGAGGAAQQAQQQAQQQVQQQVQQQAPMDADVGGAAGGGGAGGAAGDTGNGGGGPPRGVLFVQDVLAWRGYGLVDCGAEFRLFWLASKLAEEGDPTGRWVLDGGEPGPGHEARRGGAHARDGQFRLLPHWRATAEGLAAAAAAGRGGADDAADGGGAALRFVQDGLLLRHAEGHYAQGGGVTPLALLWKDESCSRYLLDTDAAGVVPEFQQVVLAYQGPPGAGVATADDPPVVLGRLPADFAARMGAKQLLRAGRLLRFSVRHGGVSLHPDGSPAGADLSYEGPANQRRGRADLISKILFQAQARLAPLRLAALVAAAAEQAARGAEEEMGDGGA
ncbi:hypothetical protein HT031_000903 [Scenedesmus sp. PABB004]|nr:hypothetical protein HT031_000903 [Scenedesmus sp. PABB004]